MQYIGIFLIFVCAHVISAGNASVTDWFILGVAIFLAVEPYFKYLGGKSD